MRYSSALVLGALAAGQATAHSIRHAGFHARRHVESKRDVADVNWKDVTYDLSDISEAEWSSILKATPAAATSAPAATSAAPAPAVTSAAKAEVAAVTSKAAASSTSEEAAATTTASSDDSGVGEAIGDLFSGLTSFVDSLGAKIGVNSKESCDTAWLGDDSNWKMNIRNQHSESIYVFCWGPEGSWVNVKTPAISIRLAPGEKQTVSFAEGFSGACTHAGAGIDSLVNGQIANTWAEFTFKPTYGVFDVSREPKSFGTPISMQGSKCLSDMETCVFKCKEGEDSCTFGYTLHNCSESNGGGKGIDYTGNGGDSGGCMMGADGEEIDMTFG
jgi:hypothetical protein